MPAARRAPGTTTGLRNPQPPNAAVGSFSSPYSSVGRGWEGARRRLDGAGCILPAEKPRRPSVLTEYIPFPASCAVWETYRSKGVTEPILSALL